MPPARIVITAGLGTLAERRAEDVAGSGRRMVGDSARVLECDPRIGSLLTRIAGGDEAAAQTLVSAIIDHPPRLAVEVLSSKRVAAGSGISYGHTHVTARGTTLGLAAIGYGHGIPRKSGNRAAVTWRDRRDGRTHRLPIVGRVAMDVLVVDASEQPVVGGDRFVVFGDPERGEIPLDEWATSVGEHAATVLACLRRVRRTEAS